MSLNQGGRNRQRGANWRMKRSRKSKLRSKRRSKRKIGPKENSQILMKRTKKMKMILKRDCPKKEVNNLSNRRQRKRKKHLKLKNRNLPSLKMIKINIEMNSALLCSIKMIVIEAYVARHCNSLYIFL